MQRFLVKQFNLPVESVSWRSVFWFPGGEIHFYDVKLAEQALVLEKAQVTVAVDFWNREITGVFVNGGQANIDVSKQFEVDTTPVHLAQRPDEVAPVPPTHPMVAVREGVPATLNKPEQGQIASPQTRSASSEDFQESDQERVIDHSRIELTPLERLFTRVEVNNLTVEILLSRQKNLVLNVDNLSYQCQDKENKVAQLSWDLVSFCHQTLLDKQSIELHCQQDEILLGGKLECFAGDLYVKAELLRPLQSSRALIAEGALIGKFNAEWQPWLKQGNIALQAEDLVGNFVTQWRTVVHESNFVLQATTNIEKAGYRNQHFLEQAVCFLRMDNRGVSIPVFRGKLVDSHGWILANAKMDRDANPRGVIRFISGADLGLAWIEPRASEGKWVAGFLPLTDPAMWYRDVFFYREGQDWFCDLLESQKWMPWQIQVEQMLLRLQQEKAPLGWIDELQIFEEFAQQNSYSN